MTDISLQDVHSAVAELRKEMESKSVDQAKVARLETVLDKYEEKSAEIVKKQVAQDQKAADLEGKLNDALASMASAKGSGKGLDDKDSHEYKAFITFTKNGEMPSAEKKALIRTDSDVAGGYLVPRMIEREVIKNLTEISPMRQFARIRPMSAKTMDIPRRLNNLVAAYEGENELGTDSAPDYGSEQITTHRLTVTVPTTQEMLLGTEFDIEREIVADVVEAFAKSEGLNFVKGDGVKKPQGFVTDARIDSFDTAASGTLAIDDCIRVSGELKTGYNPMYFMNRRTLAFLRREKAAVTGEYQWTPGGADGAPATLNGYRYSAEFIDMDSYDGGTGAIPVAFGDIGMAYRIYDRTGMTMIRDELTLKKKGIIEFTFNRFNDGRVVKPEALKLLKIKA